VSYIVEIKSMANDEFKSLHAPLTEHRLRTQLYLEILNDADLPSYMENVSRDTAIILYCQKGYGVKLTAPVIDGDYPFSPFKEFFVKRDTEAVTPFLESAGAVLDFRRSGKMPSGVCPTSFCGRAQKCPVVSECFGGNYPAI
jgi:hypothetical protein